MYFISKINQSEKCIAPCRYFHRVKHVRYILTQRCKAPDQRGANRNLLALRYYLTSNIQSQIYTFSIHTFYIIIISILFCFKRLLTRLFFLRQCSVWPRFKPFFICLRSTNHRQLCQLLACQLFVTLDFFSSALNTFLNTMNGIT